MGGGRLRPARELLAVPFSAADHFLLLPDGETHPLGQIVHVALREDEAPAVKARVFLSDQGRSGALAALRILRAVDEDSEVARIEV